MVPLKPNLSGQKWKHMASRRIGKRSGGPWYTDFRTRYRFERGVAGEFPSLIHKFAKNSGLRWLEYNLKMRVPGYDARKVTIKLFPNMACRPEVTADGPTSSKHRYQDGSLCIWYPEADDSRRWTHKDGLLELLVLIQWHLFFEAHWRETGGCQGGVWLGQEYDHGDSPKQ